MPIKVSQKIQDSSERVRGGRGDGDGSGFTEVTWVGISGIPLTVTLNRTVNLSCGHDSLFLFLMETDCLPVFFMKKDLHD